MTEHETSTPDLNDDIPFGADPTPDPIPIVDDPTMPEDPPVEEPEDDMPAAASADPALEEAMAQTDAVAALSDAIAQATPPDTTVVLSASSTTPSTHERLNVRFMQLTVPLTDQERLGLLDRITEKLAELEDLKEEKKEEVKSYNTRIKALDGEIKTLRLESDNGHGTRPIEVYDVRDNDTGRVRIIRSDNGQEVQARPMTDEERQTALPFGAEDEDDDAPIDEDFARADRDPAQLAASPEEAEEIREGNLRQERHTRAIDIAKTAKIWPGPKLVHAYVDMRDAGQLDGKGKDEDEAVEDLRKKIEAALEAGDDIAPFKDEPPVPAPKAKLKAPKGSKAKPKKRGRVSVEGSDGKELNPEPPEDDSDEDAAAERKARTVSEVDMTPAPGGAF